MQKPTAQAVSETTYILIYRGKLSQHTNICITTGKPEQPSATHQLPNPRIHTNVQTYIEIPKQEFVHKDKYLTTHM